MEKLDLVVIGAGPGGYVAAIKAAQLGLKVACIDKRPVAGGTCLNVGCIPSKALLNASHKYWDLRHHYSSFGISCDNITINISDMIAMKNKVVSDLTKGIGFLFRKNGVTFIQGEGCIVAQGVVEVKNEDGTLTQLFCQNILIATGSDVMTIPHIEPDGHRILTSTETLDLSYVPEHLAVIGGGYIGLELGSIWARLGSRVTVIEYMDEIATTLDHELRSALKKELEKQGLTFILGHKVTDAIKNETSLTLNLLSRQDNSEPQALVCDVALVCIGRKPYTDNLGLSELGIATDERGFISIDQNYQTSHTGIYAIGDCIPGPMLAHKAEEEGVAVAEYLAGKHGHVNYDVIPAVVYTSPEVASVGLNEEQVQQTGIPYKVGKFPFMANSRSKTVLDDTGFVKILTCERTDKILGVHIIGAMAGTLIGEATLAMEFGASAEDIARTCHAHPTHSEALKEAALGAFSQAIHI